MRLRSNLSNGAGTRLTAWRGAADPSPGQFAFAVDPKNSLQPCILKGSEMYWRGTVWDGTPTITVQLGNLTSLYVQGVVKGDDDIYWTFYMVDNSMLGRYVLNYAGVYTFFYWFQPSQTWVAMGALPARPCDFYNRCGPFGACVYIVGTCSCLDGFEPRNRGDWQRGNFTGGCVRRLQLQCDGTDRFVKLPGIKLPDGFSVMWNKSMDQCEAECSARCRCQAYAYANITTLNETGSRCLIWHGEMNDLGQVPAFFEDLYLRLPASELDNRTISNTGSASRNNKGLIKIILPVVLSAILLLGLCCCFFVKRLISHVDKRKTRKLLRLEEINFSQTLGSQDDMSDVPLFAFKSVKAATRNFSGTNQLGEGGFGAVYKGKLSTGHEVAVKRLSKGSNQGYREFANEIRLIAKLQHRNLVRLLGWCIHKEEKILIYEYMPNKSLDSFLFG
ncbi:hypothetical protein Taro_036507 [Colocasia esculenta]|uniref:non-specific serine/threonine protein kinase n=1 Tax=Colocasia esculenta TaxID=4460 RepID=A0A843WGI7_COLES|nr:hypothetical protein [Colocasia esculenta]